MHRVKIYCHLSKTKIVGFFQIKLSLNGFKWNLELDKKFIKKVKKMNVRKYLGYLGVGGRMILKCILKKRVKFI